MKLKKHLYIASDSTAQTYPDKEAPQAGWGQFLSNYLPEKLEVCNHAIGGRSSKTFIEEGRLTEIMKKIKTNDFLLIQMGHNDSTKERPLRYTEAYGDFKEYLTEYIVEGRKKGAIPILITPVARLHYVKNEFLADFGDYCNAIKEVAYKEKVDCIDLMKHSLYHLENIGYQEAATYFMVSHNGEDCTHYTRKGADRIARILALYLMPLLADK
ncbi:rhamnogalacturonan acetylesterase [Saliterribacillus persicus]|uniref:Lysophospholipase L1-like esterase n=1 Tax=Saliterribacillus persicus TaxID=930114 RepID=A0A368Y187_9BACI|nr:rhamnogalacturonan acetylesterase [Saliterribacillus persicus]RCW72004.1 lysophospholipase L1-like esterase [Saliterribacillus persicus]